MLDGWWAEGYDGDQRLGDLAARSTTTTAPRTRATPTSCTGCSATRSCPTFYDRDGAGIPQRWLAMVRASLRTCGPEFGAGRMLEDYARQIYPPR